MGLEKDLEVGGETSNLVGKGVRGKQGARVQERGLSLSHDLQTSPGDLRYDTS
jgi:hypothetical protein